MVESAPILDRDKVFRCQLVGDEPDLMFPQQRDDRVLHRAEPGERGHDDHGLDRGGQLPGHYDARAYPPFGECGRGRARGIVKLTGGEAAPVLIGEQLAVRLAPRGVGDQRPVRRFAHPGPDRQLSADSAGGGRNPDCAIATDTPVPIGPFGSTSMAEPVATPSWLEWVSEASPT